ncbi:hypothetical protein [Dechloromonas sp. A34]|uniref:hypothetical protein n=1 Tax=Dechloromonas sp. A34 TaxID=447588 RepID=UPI0022487B87|nr:hypothetical protein [Dechloromonas sp. A34]
MSNPLSAFTIKSHQQTARRALARSLLAVAAAFLCTSLPAADIDDNAKSNVVSAPQAQIPWMSGGIGDEARDEMRKAATAYNVQVIFSDRQGSYLANIPFAVTGRNGKEVVAGVSEGPLLYIKLPPGSYRLSAQIDGAWQHKQIQAGTTGRPVRTSFVSRGE